MAADTHEEGSPACLDMLALYQLNILVHPGDISLRAKLGLLAARAGY